MSLKDDVLKELVVANGEFVSGELLAIKYDKSRAAVWKAIKSLKDAGFDIEAVTNKGYMIKNANEIVSESLIKSMMKNDIKIFHYDSITSTNTVAKELASKYQDEVFLVSASEQTAGRGRQGKSFYSPKTGVYLSLVVHPNVALQNAVTITTAASVAVCKAIESISNLKPQIKWVNDVFLDDKKICGILTEAVTDFESGNVSSVVIGIGVNVKTKDFPKEIVDAGAINEPISFSNLIANIADNLLQIVGGNYKMFIDYYREHSMIIGKRINVIKAGDKAPATALEIDETGGLLVKYDDGKEEILRSGEISIRKV